MVTEIRPETERGRFSILIADEQMGAIYRVSYKR